MKKTIILSFILLYFVFNGFSQQNKLSIPLEKVIKQKGSESEYYKINIFLKAKANIDSLQNDFIKNKVPVKDRPELVRRLLTRTASASQQAILAKINAIMKEEGECAANIHTLWIVNMMVLDAKPSLITKLALRDDIDLIGLDNSYMLSPVEPIIAKGSSNKSPNGKEQGLIAINAPAMWALGYSGRGRVSGSVDTGVWPNHPAIKNHFLANYYPLSQCWFPFDSDVPVDKSESHGTHTVGITMGLEDATHDTIGVAFNAHFICTDPIVQVLADVKPMSTIMEAFEWMLNPDGDTTTTNDVPDAINNSWGKNYTPGDSTYCDPMGFVGSVFNAIEAAGIACVFSAGNSGPDSMTIGSPQMAVYNEVNSFTVGSVNANIAGNPISTFSSRGPTPCNVTGTLSIKPEVVAPGENVRSSIGQSDYAVYSGTSMAGPHVTGSVLLLKEAFPYLSGHDILYALYQSAVDLGVPGEDNTYGRGMIDVFAAYNYLAQTNTPVPPLKRTYDIAINEIITPSDVFYCNKTFIPKVSFINYGDSALHGATFFYKLNNEPEQSIHWSGNLLTNQSDTITLNPITALSTGDYELNIRIVNDSNVVEWDRFNNSRIARFNIRDERTLPYYEDFETGNIKNADWLTSNPDISITWDTIAAAGLTGSTHSAYINYSNYTPLASQKDGILSPVLNIPDSNSVTLEFELAYHFSGLADTLKVKASTDCGATYPYILYSKAGAALSTSTINSSSFAPFTAADWRLETANITQLKNMKVMLMVEGTNRHGNNLYIDNIHVYAGNNTYVPEFKFDANVNVYPNPFGKNINIEYKEQQLSNIQIKVYNIIGEEIYTSNIEKQKQGSLTIDMQQYKAGVYFIKYIDDKGNKNFKVIKQ